MVCGLWELLCVPDEVLIVTVPGVLVVALGELPVGGSDMD